jgi:hypothetical protein
MPKPKREEQEPMAMVLDLLATRAGMKQDVFARTREAFGNLREALKEVADELGPPSPPKTRGCRWNTPNTVTYRPN